MAVSWLPTLQGYQRDWLKADISAGIIVAVLIIPQSIAYAFLAGLPAETGLYAAMLPLLLYTLLGSSPTLAVGPVAIVSLMTLEALAPSAASGFSMPAMASVLALLVAAFMVLFYLVGLGRWTAFISHTVISAFTSAAAIVIVMNQLKHLSGLNIGRNGLFYQPVIELLTHFHQLVWPALALAALSIVILWLWPRLTQGTISKLGPLLVVTLGIISVQSGVLQVATVGAIPQGLPSLMLPALLLEQMTQLPWKQLLPSAAIIALIGYLESLSVATAMAVKSRSRLLPNQELLALGGANIAAALSQGYPVAGGFGRSMVNLNAGARSQLAAVVTALSVAIVCLFLADWFSDLPTSVLAAIIVMAVVPLIDWRSGWQAWRYQKSDGVIWLITFAGVLLMNAESGIFLGILLSLGVYLKRTSEPHIAEVGRYQHSDHFRNVERHSVTTCPQLLLVRIDENLYFANSQLLDDFIQRRLQQSADVRHVVLIGSAINHIDFDGYESLRQLITRLNEQSIQLHLAEFKGPVMDQLQHSDLLKHLAPGQVFFSASDALRQLGGK